MYNMTMKRDDGKLPQPWVLNAIDEYVRRNGGVQADFARAMGEQPATISQWFNRGYVPAAQWRRLSQVLNKSINWIAWGDDPGEQKRLDNDSGPDLVDLLESATERDLPELVGLWRRIVELQPHADALPSREKADLLMLVANTARDKITAEQLGWLIRKFGRGKP